MYYSPTLSLDVPSARSMNYNHFPSLDIMVASEYHKLYNHESVDDLVGYARGLQAERNMSDRYSEDPGKQTLGLYMGFATQDSMEHHVMRRQLGGGNWDFFTQAHEETHALHHMGALDALQQRLSASGLDINLSGYHNPYVEDKQTREMRNEYVAHIGALYAMDRSSDHDVHAFIRDAESRKGLPIGLREAIWDFSKALAKREGMPVHEPRLQDPVEPVFLPTPEIMRPGESRKRERDDKYIIVVVEGDYTIDGVYGIVPESFIKRRKPMLEDLLDEFFIRPEQRRIMELIYGKRASGWQYGGRRAYTSPY